MSRDPSSPLAQQWRDRLRRFELSDLTIAEFCSLEGYSTASFYRWRRRLTEKTNANGALAFIPVKLPPQNANDDTSDDAASSNDMRIDLPGGGVLRLNINASDQQQRRLIQNVVRSLQEVGQ